MKKAKREEGGKRKKIEDAPCAFSTMLNSNIKIKAKSSEYANIWSEFDMYGSTRAVRNIHMTRNITATKADAVLSSPKTAGQMQIRISFFANCKTSKYHKQ